MKLTFTDQSELPISNNLKAILSNTLLAESKSSLQSFEDEDDLIFNFRDPNYSVEKGGFRPVEIRLIRLNDSWRFSYITEFSYVGMGHCSELAKDLDYDLDNKIGFQLFSGERPLVEFRELFTLWQSNFVSYFEMKIFTVSVSCN